MRAFWSPTPTNRRFQNPSDGSGARGSNLSYYYIIRVVIDRSGVAFHKNCHTKTGEGNDKDQVGINSPSQHASFLLLQLLKVLPRTVPWCWYAGIWEGHHHRCPSSFSHGPQLHCSLILKHLQPEIKKYSCKKIKIKKMLKELRYVCL